MRGIFGGSESGDRESSPVDTRKRRNSIMEKMKDQNGSRMLDDQELEQVNGGQYVSIPYIK